MSPLPKLLQPHAGAETICDTCLQWQIEPDLGLRLYLMARMLPFPLLIISGYRTPERQEQLIEEGANAAPVHLSNHTVCPARAADLRPGVELITDEIKRAIGQAAEAVGLRWGGGAPRVAGIPVNQEWRHVDLGPRGG